MDKKQWEDLGKDYHDLYMENKEEFEKSPFNLFTKEALITALINQLADSTPDIPEFNEQDKYTFKRA